MSDECKEERMVHHSGGVGGDRGGRSELRLVKASEMGAWAMCRAGCAVCMCWGWCGDAAVREWCTIGAPMG